MFDLPEWFLPIIGSAFILGFYDFCKKHAVNGNPVMPVLFLATLCGSGGFVTVTLLSGQWSNVANVSLGYSLFIFLKSILVASSWACVFYAMRELPISICAPIRASAPLGTTLGAVLLFHEIPTALQGFGMVSIFVGYYLFSVLGKLEGIVFRNNRGIHYILLGTLLGAASSLYDKYLLGTLKIQPSTLQFWFSIDLVLVLGAGMLFRYFSREKRCSFQWRWSIPTTGILLILADFLYFHAVSLPDVQISVLSLIRRCNCIVAFGFGIWYFKEAAIGKKAIALGMILLGVFLLTWAG